MHPVDLQWLVPMINGALFGLLAMVLHEIGHICVAQGLGLKVKNVGICWKGMYTVRETGTPEINLQVALAGPLTNLALIPLGAFVPVFGLATFVCGLCNLLPIPGSDGMRVLMCLREMRHAHALAPQQVTAAGAGALAVNASNCGKKSVDPAA